MCIQCTASIQFGWVYADGPTQQQPTALKSVGVRLHLRALLPLTDDFVAEKKSRANDIHRQDN